MSQSEVDVDKVMAEIREEVKRRRESGDFPPGLERQLDLVFARFAPVAVVGDDWDALLERLASTTFIDIGAPIDSVRPGVPQFKRVLRKAMAFNFRHIALQVTSLGHDMVTALRILGERVERLEAAAPSLSPRLRDEAQRLGGGLEEPWQALIADRLRGVPGRVLHAECGSGPLLARLADAYGVEPDPDLAEKAVAAGLDVRPDDALEHLRALPEQSLGGLVLSGCTDLSRLADQFELADRAASVLAHDGVVVVIGTRPAAWQRAVGPVVADLAPGRPLHPETWAHLLADRGFTDVDAGARPEEARESEIYAVTAIRS